MSSTRGVRTQKYDNIEVFLYYTFFKTLFCSAGSIVVVYLPAIMAMKKSLHLLEWDKSYTQLSVKYEIFLFCIFDWPNNKFNPLNKTCLFPEKVTSNAQSVFFSHFTHHNSKITVGVLTLLNICKGTRHLIFRIMLELRKVEKKKGEGERERMREMGKAKARER